MIAGVTATDDLIAANDRYAPTFPGPRPTRPKLQLAVLTCMDSRLDLFGALGLEIGDAHLLRNAGGLPTDDALRSLAISQRALGTREVVVMHHTRCGMEGFDDVAFRDTLATESGEAPPWDVPGFTDPAEQLRRSLERIRTCGWLPHRDAVRGFVFDVDTARIDEVV